jgi:aryl sulfotransferase
MPGLPDFKHAYRNHHIDSTRWDDFTPRGDDIVIATSYKAGTTWTQAIVGHLLFPDGLPAAIWELSPWLDFRPPPRGEFQAILDAQTHRRFIKTHLPLHALRFFPQMKYIFVSRDGRDVFMSMWNHYRAYTDDAVARFNGPSGDEPRPGEEFPAAPDGIKAFWRDWCTRGWFPFESDGWPFWSHLSVTQSWWDYRDLPNILVLHYADMKADTAGAVARVARFLDLDRTPEQIAAVAGAVSFKTMKAQAGTYVPNGGRAWKGGAETFLNKGTNRRWEGLFSDEDLALYDQACAQVLSPDCRAWLDAGGEV